MSSNKLTHMLTIQPRSKFIEKILMSQTGQQFTVTFLVSFVGGEMKARMISAIPFDASAATAHSAIFLPTPRAKAVTSFEYIPAFAPIVSPLHLFDFFISQPTRAPSFSF